MSTIGWLFIFGAIFLVRAVFKGQVLDGSGSFILPDILQQYMVAFITNDTTKLRELESMRSSTGLLQEGEKPPSPEDSNSFPRAQMGSGTRPKAPVPGGKVSYPFGARNSRYKAGYHTGVDYANPNGSRGLPVMAVVGGVTLGQTGGSAYGNHVMIKGTDGHTWLYAHLQDVLVKPGQTVIRGSTIGHVGSSGVASGFAHLHMEQSSGPNWAYGKVKNPSW